MHVLRFDDAPPGEDGLARRQPGFKPGLPWPEGRGLTPRERELVQLVRAGRTNPEIAEQLCKSRATVRNQLHSAYEKLGITRRSQLIAARRN